MKKAKSGSPPSRGTVRSSLIPSPQEGQRKSGKLLVTIVIANGMIAESGPGMVAGKQHG